MSRKDLSIDETIRSIEGKDIRWVSMKINENLEKKQIGIVKPILSLKTVQTSKWNYSELEKLEKRCSELIDRNPLKSNRNSIEILHIDLIERFQSLYSSLACQIFICPHQIEFYQLSDVDICSFQQWKYLSTGYPMWIFNTGQNPRRFQELRLSIIDDQTGFILWSDRITTTSNLISTNSTIVSFRHSTFDSFQMIRFPTIDEKSFQDFIGFYRDKQNFLFLEKFSRIRTNFEKRRIKKSQISHPNQYHHWNHLKRIHFDSFNFQKRFVHFYDENILNIKSNQSK